jgi:hypothetical protein
MTMQITQLTIGFVCGAVVVGIFWIIVSLIRSFQRNGDIKRCNKIKASIGELMAAVTNAAAVSSWGSVRSGGLPSLNSAKFDEITSELYKNMHLFDPFFVKYVEKFIDEHRTPRQQESATRVAKPVTPIEVAESTFAPKTVRAKEPKAVSAEISTFDPPTVKVPIVKAPEPSATVKESAAAVVPKEPTIKTAPPVHNPAADPVESKYTPSEERTEFIPRDEERTEFIPRDEVKKVAVVKEPEPFAAAGIKPAPKEPFVASVPAAVKPFAAPVVPKRTFAEEQAVERTQFFSRDEMKNIKDSFAGAEKFVVAKPEEQPLVASESKLAEEIIFSEELEHPPLMPMDTDKISFVMEREPYSAEGKKALPKAPPVKPIPLAEKPKPVPVPVMPRRSQFEDQTVEATHLFSRDELQNIRDSYVAKTPEKPRAESVPVKGEEIVFSKKPEQTRLVVDDEPIFEAAKSPRPGRVPPVVQPAAPVAAPAAATSNQTNADTDPSEDDGQLITGDDVIKKMNDLFKF